MKRYVIISDMKIKCCVESVINKGWGWIIKIKSPTSDRILAHLQIRHLTPYQKVTFNRAMKNKELCVMHRNLLISGVGVYKRFTWLDCSNKKCKPAEIGMVERDENGEPVVYHNVVLYDRFEDVIDQKLLADNFFINNYVEIDSPEAVDALNFKGRGAFNTCYNQCVEKYNDCSNDYDPDVQNENFFSMSDEDRIMDALENGNGELYGY